MPELPEVEILVRHLQPVLRGRVIRNVTVLRPKIVRPENAATLSGALVGRTIRDVRRRAKYLLFELAGGKTGPGRATQTTLVGHLGMTGRMFLQPKDRLLPKHTTVTLDLGRNVLVFEDTRYFGRLNLDLGALERLGPEPLGNAFTPAMLLAALARSTQPIKVKLLDQTLVAGLGNIYVSEALFRAGIHPRCPARRINPAAATRLVAAIREVLAEAIRFGSTIPLSLDPSASKNDLFYYGQSAGREEFYDERLRVYDRAAQPCLQCATPIRRFVQAARSTYWCPNCQRR